MTTIELFALILIASVAMMVLGAGICYSAIWYMNRVDCEFMEGLEID